jgi:hypothetical protein
MPQVHAVDCTCKCSKRVACMHILPSIRFRPVSTTRSTLLVLNVINQQITISFNSERRCHVAPLCTACVSRSTLCGRCWRRRTSCGYPSSAPGASTSATTAPCRVSQYICVSTFCMFVRLYYCCAVMGLMWIPVKRSWRLNERHYGALQGAAAFAAAQV